MSTSQRPLRLAPLLLAAVALVLSACAHGRGRTPPPGDGQVWVFTYLKARPGQVDNLAEYIRRNWFAMDAAARRDGAIVDYQLLRPTAPDTAWDLLEVTVFADSAQHARADSVYRAVYRPAHRVVRVSGLEFGALGAVVRTVTTRRTGGRP